MCHQSKWQPRRADTVVQWTRKFSLTIDKWICHGALCMAGWPRTSSADALDGNWQWEKNDNATVCLRAPCNKNLNKKKENYGEFMVLYNRKLTSFQLARWLSSQRHTTDRVMRSGRSSNQSWPLDVALLKRQSFHAECVKNSSVAPLQLWIVFPHPTKSRMYIICQAQIIFLATFNKSHLNHPLLCQSASSQTAWL